MGGAVKKIVSVAIAVAIPFVAPAWGATLFPTLPGWASGAAVGVGVGAVSGAVGGGNIGRSALIGGLSGGIAGGFGGGSGGGGGGGAAPTPPPPPPPTAAAGTSQYSITAGGVPSLTAPIPTVTAPTAIAPTTTPFTVDYGLTSGFAPSTAAFGEGAFGTGLNIAAGEPTFSALRAGAGLDIGAQLSGATAAPAAGVGAVDYGLTGAAPGISPSAGLATPTSLTAGGATPSLSAMPTAATAATGAPTAGAVAAGAPAATAPLTAGQKAWEFTKSIGGDILKTGAVMYALGAGNVPGEIPEEMMAQYQQEFARLAEQNPEAYQQKLQEAQKFIQMASTFDPQYFGEEEARKAQIRGGRAKRAGLRGLTGRQRAAAERQFDIATGREAGTSYTQGAQRALTGQIQTTEAGLKLMPRPSDYTSLSNLSGLSNLYGNQATARRQYAQDIGALADLGAGIYEKGRTIYG